MDDLAVLERGRRLGSPSHWRGYFTFEQPSYAVGDDEIGAFLAAAGSNYLESVRIFRELLKREHAKRGHYADVLIDRLAGMPAGSLSSAQHHGIISTFAHVMDDAVGIIGPGILGDRQLWRRSEKLLTREIADLFQDLILNAPSVNWFAFVIRQQGFAHGRPGGTPRESANLWLAPDELNVAIDRVVKRLTMLDAEVFTLPAPLDALYCWLELGDGEQLRMFISDHTFRDENFLDALSAMRVWHNSSDKGVYYPLYKKYVAQFMDAHSAKERLDQLALDGEFVERARDLKKMWREDGD